MDDAVGIAFLAGLPFAGLRGVALDATLVAGFPPGWLATRQVVPLAFDPPTLTLASASPTPDLSGLDPALTITLVIAPAAEITALLAAVEPPPVAPPPQAPPPRPAPSRAAVPLPDREALAAIPEHLQRRLRCLPLSLDDDAITVAVAADPLPQDALDALARAVAPRAVVLLAADPAALDERLVEVHGARWAAAIRRGLPRVARPAAPARTADDPPQTTLLLPLAGGVGPAVQAATTLAALDHPHQQLEVLLLVEADDAAGARAARTTGHRVVVAPTSLPDDPLALLDLGLLLARGDHIAVLDPGDIPAPRLLDHADRALAAEGVAAASTHQPPQQAPAPRRLGLRRAAPPPPLPATGVVVRRDVLDAVGGWRDLALKLHEARLRVVALDDAVASATERS